MSELEPTSLAVQALGQARQVVPLQYSVTVVVHRHGDTTEVAVASSISIPQQGLLEAVLTRALYVLGLHRESES